MSDPKAIERANSYRTMMGSWAWKDFEEILKTERQTALEQAVVASRIEDVNIYRGVVKCIDSINSEIDSITRMK